MINNDDLANKIFNLLNNAKSILLLTHQKPDGDAIGALYAFGEFLEHYQKDYSIFLQTDIKKEFSFLGNNENIINDFNIIKNNEYDCVIVLDSGDLYYTGLQDYIKSIRDKATIINIDHHETNEMFGDINYVDTTSASTTQILYNFFGNCHMDLSKKMANSLLTGIITDTGSFTNGATTLGSIDVAADLLLKGACFPKIVNNLNSNFSIELLRMWGDILSRMEKNNLYDMAIVVICENDLKKYNLSNDAADGLANFLNNLNGVKASLVLREIGNNKIKGSLRTTLNNVDVSRFASFMGGGGHRKSAGFTINGKIVKKDNHWEIIKS